MPARRHAVRLLLHLGLLLGIGATLSGCEFAQSMLACGLASARDRQGADYMDTGRVPATTAYGHASDDYSGSPWRCDR